MLPKDTTVGDVVRFILSNRRGLGFDGWSVQQLIFEVYESIEDKCLVVSYDQDEEINGVAIGIVINEGRKLFRVSNILTKDGSKNALKLLLNKFRELYPDWIISASRHRREKILGGDRFFHLVNVLT